MKGMCCPCVFLKFAGSREIAGKHIIGAANHQLILHWDCEVLNCKNEPPKVRSPNQKMQLLSVSFLHMLEPILSIIESKATAGGLLRRVCCHGKH
eukprot:2803363-Amphidinium_carterae.1